MLSGRTYMHPFTGSALVFTALFLLYADRLPKLFYEFGPAGFGLLALTRVLELSVPDWPAVLPVADLKDMQIPSSFAKVSATSALSILFISCYQFCLKRTLFALLFFLSTLWMITFISVLEAIYNSLYLSGDLSGYSFVGFLLCCLALSQLAAQKFEYGIITGSSLVLRYIRAIVVTAVVVPSLLGFAFTNSFGLNENEKTIALLLFAFTGWFVAVVVILLGYVMEKEHKRVFNRSQIDGLTGLLNRRAIEELIDISSNPYGIILLDLDHFKEVNDTHGHAAGDEVLRNVANLLQSSLRKDDHVARWSGEEFVIALRTNSIDELKEAAERLRSRIGALNTSVINEDNDFELIDIKVTASLGCSMHIPKGSTLADAIEKADGALYEAKARGRDQVRLLLMDKHGRMNE
ncbi:diguanylate cyclase [Roseibium sp. TrichSKD4]|nr:diguanylate cyclase [Roseibium sp. TrichSKD4]